MRQPSLFFALALLSAGSVSASAIYNVTLNTSSASGTTGSIDFGLFPGAGADQSLTATVSNFSTNGSYLGSQTLTGNATGGPVMLGDLLTLVTTTQDNDDLETIRFGTTLSFTVSLTGPELTAPNGFATSSDQFIFETYSDAAGTVPVLQANSLGFSGIVNVSPEGVVTTTAVSPLITLAAAPEPGTLALIFASGALFALRRRARCV